MIDAASLMWLRLRERRGSIHERSELMKDSSSRRKTFAAAMQQFEEQMTAAKVVTPATSPLNLYYGLAQAGLAIVAAYAPEPWTPRSSHGLKLIDTEPHLADIHVRTDGNGSFQAVASRRRFSRHKRTSKHRQPLGQPSRYERKCSAPRHRPPRSTLHNPRHGISYDCGRQELAVLEIAWALRTRAKISFPANSAESDFAKS